jgi:hypothetical protein
MENEKIPKEVQALREVELYAKELKLAGIRNSFDETKKRVTYGELYVYRDDMPEFPCTVSYVGGVWLLTFPFVRRQVQVKKFSTVMDRVRDWLNAEKELVDSRSARLVAPKHR